MRVHFLNSALVLLIGLLSITEIMAQQPPKGVNSLLPYSVSLSTEPTFPFRNADGQPLSFSSLTGLIDKTRNGLSVEALNLYSNAVGSDDWHRLRKLRSLRTLAVSVPDTSTLNLDSLLLNLADLPNLETLRIGFFTIDLPRRRVRRSTDTTDQKPALSVPQPPIVPVTGFPALRSLQLSGDKIPANQLIDYFSGHSNLQRVELWGGWDTFQKALPDLSRLPNLTELLIDGRGWLGWEAAFRGLSGLRVLRLSSIYAGGPRARSHDEENPIIKAFEKRHITDLNRGLAQLIGLQQLELSHVAQVKQLQLGNLPALTHLRLKNVTPSDTTFMGMVGLNYLMFEECYLPSLLASVCSLPQLIHLELLNQSNIGEGFKTVIPACLSRIKSLTALTIANNPIHHMPLKVGDLPRLRHLRLTACQLDTFPAFITGLRALQYLDIRGNNISFIPDTIRALRQLDTLELDGNHLTKLPDFLPQLKQLRVLAIGGNNISRLPDRIGDLDSLRQLSIGDNALTTLPQSLSQLRRLQSLTIGKNQLTELPNWLGQLDELNELAFDMPLTVLPPSLLRLRRLKNLFLRNTQLRTIPMWIGLLKQLENVRLESDYISRLPEGFGCLPNLRILSVIGEKLNRLPNSFGQLSELTNLTIRGNRDGNASGTGNLARLPASLVNCKKLHALMITDQPHLNVVALFTQLAQLPALGHVDLSGNRIRTLPPLNWKRLRWRSVGLANNDLTIPPSELAQIPDLQMLDLRSNALPGLLNQSFHNHVMIREALLSTTTNR